MRLAILTLAVVAALACCGSATAQSGSFYTQDQLARIQHRNSAQRYSGQQIKGEVYRQSVPTYNFNSLNRDLFKSALTGRPLQKPFSNMGRSSVSPYLGLSAPFSSTAEQYYTQVRPQLEQQRINQQMASRNAQLQHQLNTMAAQPPYQLQGSDDMAPTGHVAAYMNYGGYYPPVEVPKK